MLYLAGAFTATVFEYMVGRLMLRLFGEVWWDYREKPFNYQGIICLESTIAWGFYAVIIIGYLHQAVMDCLLYTSDAADDLLCVDLGGSRIIKKKN